MAAFWSGFARSKMGKVMVYGFVLFAMLLGLSLAPFNAGGAKAAACSVYTDYHNSKPALYVWSPNRDIRIAVFFYGRSGWESVKNGGDGIVQDKPQNRSGGWAIYYISTRWRNSNPYRMDWNSDWRWQAGGC